MPTIEYTRYSFIPPNVLDEHDFSILKEALTQNSKFNINPMSSFLDKFQINLIFIGAGGLGLILALLEIADWLTTVGGIIALIAFLSLFSFIPSLFSYLDFISVKSSYYRGLKRDILKSNTYEEFIFLRKQIDSN